MPKVKAKNLHSDETETSLSRAVRIEIEFVAESSITPQVYIRGPSIGTPDSTESEAKYGNPQQMERKHLQKTIVYGYHSLQ